jgi:outer membrane protein assembly factor BamB
MRNMLRMPAGTSRRVTTRKARLPATAGGALLCALLACLLGGPLARSARGEPSWTTYHHDASRSGLDPEAGEPVVPSPAWHSQDLGAPIWGQPLLLGGTVYVATVGDRIDALSAATGAVLWSTSIGTPVPAGALPCGDVTPTVGIVGTPVIDVARRIIYAVADTWDATKAEARHVLVGLNLAGGERVLEELVDPPGADPKALLQRTALNLDQGNVVFGLGGNDGDCGKYRGAVVAAPEDGSSTPRYWQVPLAAPSSSGGAVWGASGPAIDGEGHIYATTGNPNPPSGQQATSYDYSDSVVELDPSLMLLGHFEPASWALDSNSDLDLGSAGAEPLPGGVLFQAGKNGLGYLIDEAQMPSGAPALYSHQVCAGHGSFGGDAYANGVIYLPCTNGVQALVYDQAARAFTPLWQGPASAVGPPIVSAGLIWSAATGGSKGGGTKLYGLDPSTGAPRYVETLPSPITDHFGSPSAGGGRLFLATGSSVSAYTVATIPPSVQAPPAAGPPPPTHHRSVTSAILLYRRLHVGSHGRVRLALRCIAAPEPCRGTLTLQARFLLTAHRGGRRVPRVLLITLVRSSFGPARGDFIRTLRLDASARAHLRLHPAGLALRVTIVCAPGLVRVFRALLK